MDDVKHMLIWLAAMFVSEGWFACWHQKGKRPVHYRARGIVVFDRALNQEWARQRV